MPLVRLPAGAALFLAVLPAVAPRSSAAQSRTELPPLVVTASRIPASLPRLSAATTVITREEIAARQPASALDLLREAPGLHVDQPGGRGGVASLYLRGGDPNHTLVLIDGVQVNDPTNARGGSYDLSLLAPELIERIEIVRGPMSAVYGSDALAGVVNIVTRKGGVEPEATVETALGRFGYAHAAASISGPAGGAGRARMALGAAYTDEGEPVEGNAFAARSVTAGVSLSPTQASLLEAMLQLSAADRESFPEDSGGPGFAVRRAPDERKDRQIVFGTTFAHELRPGWSYKLHGGYYARDDAFDSPGVAPGPRDPFGIPSNFAESEFRRIQATGSSELSLGDAVRVTAGLDAEHEDGETAGGLRLGAALAPTGFALDRGVLAPFAELQYAPAEHVLVQASLRWDVPEEFDAELSPRLGVSYAVPGGGPTLRASWGEGFKLPSFFALGHPIVGNPDLVPETSEGFEVGIGQDLLDGRASLGATYFDTRYENAVDFDEGPPPRLVNRSEVLARGVELVFEWRPGADLEFAAHATYTHTDIEGTAEELRNRPEWRGGGRATWRPRSDLTLSLSALYVGEALDSSIPTGDVTLDPYLRVDVAAEWRLAPRWSAFVAIDNLLDAEYEEFVGFSSRGVRPRFGGRVRF